MPDKPLPKVKEYDYAWVVKCPAKGFIEVPRDGRWSYNGDPFNPTFSPSINEAWGKPGQSLEDFRREGPAGRNHCFIRDGKIEYLGDCTHRLAGQTVDIPPLTRAEVAMYYPDLYPDLFPDE
jgi:hypothetical protein